MKKHFVKLAIVAMIAIVLVVGVILVILRSDTSNLVSNMLLSQSVAANRSFSSTFDEYQAQALERAEMIAASNDIVNSIMNDDEEALRKALSNYSVGFDLITLCDENGDVLARTHSDQKGDSVISQKAIATALSTGKGISTIEKGSVIGLSTRGSAAIKDSNGNIIGALTCGHDLSQPKYIDRIKQLTGCEATFFAGDERMSTTIIDESGNRAVGTKASDAVIDTVINNRQSYSGRTVLFGSMYEGYYSPVIVDGQVLGMLFTGLNIDSFVREEQKVMVMILIAGIMLLLAVFVTFALIKQTVSKSYWYESILDSIPFPISVTDMKMNWTFINTPVEQMLGKKRSELLGKPCSTWGAAICKTSNCGIECLRCGKNQTNFEQMDMDFRVDLNYLHDSKGRKAGHIEIVQDITEMVKTQNAEAKMVESINDVIESFVTGTKQIADGATALAQGATEQSAAVQQLSGSITDVAQKTKENAQLASHASDLANSIKSSAEKGSEQMGHMMSAVKEINDASQSINKVISVIDNIAFQTNILALNAAVEAARAGQHGKGFAVVAEEVRSLAAKSAEAASETSGLIANSIEKAELGSRIAGETSASFVEIVAGINESTKIVGDIAKSSEEQSTAISQINIGVDQIAQVVQQNSATAEQSAAASQELSGQSNMLHELITEFRNRADNSENNRLSSGSSQKLLK